MTESVKVFALTTRGLEPLSAAEMRALPGVQVRDIVYRRVTAVCTGDLAPLLTLRTVDDVFIDVATWHGLVRQRDALSVLGQQAGRLDLRAAVRMRSQVEAGPIESRHLRFSITASFVGKRNYTTDDIKHCAATAISAHHGWEYMASDAEADVNVRLFLEHDRAFVGVRLGDTPLHRRAYKHAHVLGSLKPPVAFAMLALADVAPDTRLLDPCCGAGTILIEGARLGATVCGGDLYTEVLAAARANIRSAGVAVALHRWDAQCLALADASVDTLVCNPPWGRAVAAGVDQGVFYRRLCAEIGRVLRPGGRVVLLTSVPDLVYLPEMRLETQLEISLFGQNPKILVYSCSKQVHRTSESASHRFM